MSKYKTYLDFVRYSLNPKDGKLEDVAEMDWEGFFLFAEEQGILGMMYDGRWKMVDGRGKMVDGRGKGDDGFVDDLTLEWGFIAHQIEDQNRAVNVAAVKLLRSLRKRGFEGCTLKGQGNGLMYPNPYRRTPGDIDVWVRKGESLEVRGESLEDDVRGVIRFVKRRNPEARAVYHHIDGGVIGGIDVEVHYRPSFMNNPIHNRRLQRWFGEKAPEQFGHWVTLPHTEITETTENKDFKICVPTREFNVVYQLVHVLRHLLQEGIGLRQIIDYYFLLRKKRLEVSGYGLLRGEQWKETLRYLGLWKIAEAMMWVLSEVLGLEEEYLIAPKDERLGRVLLAEILNGGNFGQYDSDGKRKEEEGRVMKNWQRIRRDIRMMRYFPSECLWEPVFRVYHFFWRRRYN